MRPDWPEREVHLYGPGADSGTFDYFTEVINGKSQRCRADHTASEDDNVLARIADLATNIAEDVVFMVEGEVIRHRHDDAPPPADPTVSR